MIGYISTLFSQYKLFSFRFMITAFFISALTNLGIWALFFWHLQLAEEIIPLHYSIYFGIDSLGPKEHLFFLPLFGLLVLLVNTVAGLILFQHEKILSHFLTVGHLVTQLLILMAALSIIILTL